MTGRGSVSKLFIHFGMLCAALAFASWWTSHTILDTARTRRVTEAVLESADLRHFVADHVASVTAPAVGVTASAATTNGAYTNHLDAVLGRRDIQLKLEQFVVDAHERLLGERSQPAVLDQATVRTLVAAAFPSVRAADLAKVHAVTFDVPQSQALFKSREAFAHRFWLYFLGAVALLTVGLVTTDDRHARREAHRQVADRHHGRASDRAVDRSRHDPSRGDDQSVGASRCRGRARRRCGNRDGPRCARTRRRRVLVRRPLHPGVGGYSAQRLRLVRAVLGLAPRCSA